MDEIPCMTQAEFFTPIQIKDEDAVYRQVPSNHLINQPDDDHTRYPKPKHFKPDPDGLSTHCCRLITLDQVFHIISLTYKHGKTDYKDPKNYLVFKLPVEFIRSIDNMQDVIHTPV